MFKKIVLGLLAVVAILLVVIATRPATFELKRSQSIKAPPDIVYAQVNDFRAWSQWSPWDKLDPNQKRTFGGPPTGVGATYHWLGNDQVGEGTMAITEAKPYEHIDIDLNFLKPFAAKNRTNFTFAKTAEGTTVTWAMSGTNDFMGKAVSLFMDMDKMVGGDFERGLAQMKVAAEQAAHEVKPDAVAVPLPAADANP